MAVTSRIDLSQEIRDWEDAEYGEEVRSAQISALQKTQTHVNTAIDNVNQAATDVKATTQSAANAIARANSTIDRADSTVDYADSILEGATQQSGHSADRAKLSESWAVGGTGVRAGENTNNSEYHSNQARTSAEAAKNEADRAAQYSQIVAPGFYFDPGTAGLYMKSGVGVDFKAIESRLYWKIL